MTDPAGVGGPAARPELERALEEARRRGFFGPRPVTEQLAHARSFTGLIEAAGIDASPFLDLGSGGGLPGLVLAEAWPEATGALLDSSARRCTFLRETVEGLGWADRVRVVEGRGEELARRGDLRAAFPLVVARSFGSPPVTAEIGGAFVMVGGALVVSEPESGEDRWPDDGLRRLGLLVADRERGEGARIVVLRRTEPIEDGWPRAIGVPAKRPLW